MKRISWIRAILLFAIASALHGQAIDTLRLLFIGNSHTYYNGLPSLVENLARSAGRRAIVDMCVHGGWRLEQHRADSATVYKINNGPWDYVILQEQSQVPVIPYWRDSSMYPACRSFDTLIRANGATTALFLTWGWKNGGQMVYQGCSSIVFQDYFHMQDSVIAAFEWIARDLGDDTLVPVGRAWRRARVLDSLVGLWDDDNYHPTQMGSYLAACVFVAKLFQVNPIGLRYVARLNWADALFCQTVAYETVFGVTETEPPTPAVPRLTAYPNPFRNDIRFTIHDARCMDKKLSLMIYDISGRLINSLSLPIPSEGRGLSSPGDGATYSLLPTVVWDGTDQDGQAVPPGVYFIRLDAGATTVTSKIIKLE